MSVPDVRAQAVAPKTDGIVVLRGRAALVELLGALQGPAAKLTEQLTSWLRVLSPRGELTRFGTHGTATPEGWAVPQALAALVDGGVLEVSRLLTTEDADPAHGGGPEREFIACAVLRMELAELLAPGGPLAGDDYGRGANGAPSPALSASQRSRARAFALEHLRNACFAPTCIVERSSVLDLVYALHPPVLEDRQGRAEVAAVGAALCDFLHATRPLDPLRAIDVTELVDEQRVRCLLLKLPQASAWNGGLVLAQASRLRNALAIANPPYRPGQASASPPAMGLRTLPPAWDLFDFALEPHERQHLASDGPNLVPDPDVLREITRALARRGHGWLDVEALARDPRYRLHALLGVHWASLRSFKQHFRAVLGDRDPRHPVRLPFGILRMSRVVGTEPGERARYDLTGRNAGRPFQVVVDWDTLASPAATARAIGRVIQRMPILVSTKVWQAIFDLALVDPRVTRTVQSSERPAALSLTSHIRGFLAKAQDMLGAGPPTTSRDPAGWPRVRDGVVVFPRPVLEAHLAAAGVAHRRKELTLAIESLGGGPRGVMHFHGVGKVRVWFAPILSHA